MHQSKVWTTYFRIKLDDGPKYSDHSHRARKKHYFYEFTIRGSSLPSNFSHAFCAGTMKFGRVKKHPVVHTKRLDGGPGS
jgi:hypothetical protein